MIKKILPIILCLILVFGISVSATNTQGDTPAENSQATEEMPERQERPQGGGRGNMGMPPNMPSGEAPPELPEGMTPPEMPNGEMPPQMNGQANSENQQTGQPSSGSNAENTTATEGNTNPNATQRGKGNMGGFRGEMPPGMTEQEQKTEEKAENKILTFVKTYSTPIISVVLLAFAFLFVIFYKRKSY